MRKTIWNKFIEERRKNEGNLRRQNNPPIRIRIRNRRIHGFWCVVCLPGARAQLNELSSVYIFPNFHLRVGLKVRNLQVKCCFTKLHL